MKPRDGQVYRVVRTIGGPLHDKEYAVLPNQERLRLPWVDRRQVLHVLLYHPQHPVPNEVHYHAWYSIRGSVAFFDYLSPREGAEL